MRRARSLQPLIAIDFVIADDVAHAIGKNFRAAAGQRVYARTPLARQGFRDRELRSLAQDMRPPPW